MHAIIPYARGVNKKKVLSMRRQRRACPGRGFVRPRGQRPAALEGGKPPATCALAVLNHDELVIIISQLQAGAQTVVTNADREVEGWHTPLFDQQ